MQVGHSDMLSAMIWEHEKKIFYFATVQLFSEDLFFISMELDLNSKFIYIF